jgi:hypothetical protein
MALGRLPPTGFLRDLVLERGGGRRGVLGSKQAGVSPSSTSRAGPRCRPA